MTTAEASFDRPAARRTLAVVMRVGSMLLASGATTDEVEVAMGAIARASGLSGVTAIVQFGTISVSYDPDPDLEPITVIRVARNETTDYARLAAASDLAERLIQSRMTVDEALREVERIEGSGRTYTQLITTLAAGASAGGSTVLFGGGPIDVAVAALATIATAPVLTWLAGSGLPAFFRNVLGPAVATVIVLLLVLVGLPAVGPLVVTGAILMFLPGGALTAGMRDLIDGSIVSGTARVFEAIMLGAAVGIGVSIGLGIASLWGSSIDFELPGISPLSIGVQAVAAAIACGAFALRSQVPRRHIASIALIGAVGLILQRAGLAAGMDDVLAAGVAAVAIGAAGRWVARRRRMSASIWIGAATLPLLPGALLVEGLLNAPTGGGSELLVAILVGFAIGIGAALGDVLVATVRQINQSIVQPVVVAPTVGLVEEGLSWVSRATGGDHRDEGQDVVLPTPTSGEQDRRGP